MMKSATRIVMKEMMISAIRKITAAEPIIATVPLVVYWLA